MNSISKLNLFTKLALGFIVGCLVILVILRLPFVFTRGMSNGVGCWMEGTVKDINPVGENIQVQFYGKVTLKQYQAPRLSKLSVIVVNCDRGIPATLSQGEIFIATTPDERGGAVRHKSGELLKILNAAAAQRRTVKFELTGPTLAFEGGRITNVVSAVVRATDADLK